jgi:ABC-type phosphate transport system substrate-binding protein
MIDRRFRRLVIAAVGLTLTGRVAFAGYANSISVAGATFPYPVYSKWADAYAKETHVKLNHQDIGSGSGIKQITPETVYFSASESDAPLKPEELDKAGLVQFPVVMGGVVPVINIRAIRVQVISKYIERIGDHAANVAERVIFIVTGEDMRHFPRMNHSDFSCECVPA